MDVRQRLALGTIQAGFTQQDAEMRQRQMRAEILQAERLELAKAISALAQVGDHESIAALGQKIAEIDRELRKGQ